MTTAMSTISENWVIPSQVVQCTRNHTFVLAKLFSRKSFPFSRLMQNTIRLINEIYLHRFLMLLNLENRPLYIKCGMVLQHKIHYARIVWGEKFKRQMMPFDFHTINLNEIRNNFQLKSEGNKLFSGAQFILHGWVLYSLICRMHLYDGLKKMEFCLNRRHC